MPNWLKAWRLAISTAILAVFVVTASAEDFVPGRLLVKFKSGVSDLHAATVIANNSGQQTERIDDIDVRILSFPANANVRAIQERLSNLPEVQFAEVDRYTHVCGVTPNDPWYAVWQPQLPQINAPAAWSLTTGSPSVIIGILDTGVEVAHPDLAPNALPGWNTYSNSSDITDTYGHGSRVAGVACAASNNGIGVASVAWNCKFIPVKVTDSSGNATYSALASGVLYALNHGARVVNMSFQLTQDSTLDSALSKLQAAGGVAVAAAGNYGTNDGFPANPYVITVSGVNGDDTLSQYSSYGNDVDLSAPINAYSTNQANNYTSVSGTSFSAPMVAGAAALVISANPSLTSSQVEHILESSADDKGALGWDPYFGYGRLNVGNAVAQALGTVPADTTPPTVAITTPTNGSTASSTVNVFASASDNNVLDHVGFFVDGVQVASCTSSPYSFNWDTTTCTNGSHSIKAVAVDAANNSASSTISVTVSNGDTIPPTISLLSPPSSSGSVTLTANASDNVGVASVTFTVDGTQIANDVASPYTATWNTTTAANGNHTVTATARDAAGNSASASITVNVYNADATPPTVSLTAPVGGSGISGTITLSATASDNVGVSSVNFYCDGSLIGTSTAAPYSCTWDSTTVPDGAHTLTAVAADAAGNTASSSAGVTVSNNAQTNSSDTIAPTIAIKSPSNGSTIGKTGLKVTVNAADNVCVVKVELYMDGSLAATSTSSPWSCSVSSNKIARGTHSIYCIAYDAAGNQGYSQTISVVK